MSRAGKLAKNTMILSIGTFLPKLAAFVTLPILTGCLTKEEYGTYDLVTVLVSLLLPAATLQIQTAAFRFLIDVRKQEDRIKAIITNIFVFTIVMSVLALSVLLFFIPGSIPVKAVVCGYLFADIMVNGARQVARGLEMNLFFSISAIVSAIGKIAFSIVFVWWLHMGLTGALITLLLASTISFVVIVFSARIYQYIDYRTLSFGEIQSLVAYSWPMVPNSMSMWVMRVSDRFVVTLFLGLSANAVYSVANKIPSLLTLAQSTFTMAWQENASIASGDEDADAYYSIMFSRMYNLMAGALGVLICITPILFRLFIRGDYGEAYYQMPVLFIAMFFYSMCAYLGGIYVAYKDTKSVGITTVAAAICNLVTDLLLIRYIGLYAASGSTLISYLFLFIFRMIDVRRLVKITYDIKHILIVFVILIIESVLCFMQRPILNFINVVFGVTVMILLNRDFIAVLWKKGCAVLAKHKSKNG